MDSNPFSLAKNKPLAVKIIGLGGAGLQVIEPMLQSDLRELAFVAVHTSARALAASNAPCKLLFGTQMIRGLGAGGDPDLGKAAAEEEIASLKSVCEGADLIFIVAGLGGGTATGAAPILARLGKEAGALVLGVVTTPFEFEGARRQQQARLGLQRLKAAADGVLCLSHERMTKLIDPRATALEAFQRINEMLAQGIRGIWQTVTRYGLLNVDFADLCAVLRGRHFESLFATATAEGEDRARIALEELLASPLLDEGKFFSEAEAVLINLMGGPDLCMTDVNWIMQQINERAGQAQFVVGASIDDSFQGRLGLTVVVSRRGVISKEDTGAKSNCFLEVGSSSEGAAQGMENQMASDAATRRSGSRFVPPPPDLSPEQTMRLLAQRGGSSARRRKSGSRWSQGQLPLEIISKGRFEKSEPTVHQGEDLDVPTYIRRGVALN